MQMKKISREYRLSADDMDAVSLLIESVLKEQNCPSRKITEIRIKAEEAMLFYRAQFGEGAPFTFQYHSGLNSRFSLLFPGRKVRPCKR